MNFRCYEPLPYTTSVMIMMMVVIFFVDVFSSSSTLAHIFVSVSSEFRFSQCFNHTQSLSHFIVDRFLRFFLWCSLFRLFSYHFFGRFFLSFSACIRTFSYAFTSIYINSFPLCVLQNQTHTFNLLVLFTFFFFVCLCIVFVSILIFLLCSSGVRFTRSS